MIERVHGLETQLRHSVRNLYPGLALCVVLALAASFLADHYAAPALLLVLLLGVGFSNQASDIRLRAGVDFCSRHLLRLGVALLGARIGMEQLSLVGHLPLLVVGSTVPLIIGAALVLGRWLGLPTMQSLVAGVAVAICGVSAAVAVAAVIPRGRLEDRRLLGVVVGVTAMGTLAMLIYPPVLSLLGYGELQAGLLLGASIHDVAQASAAGYLVSGAAGDIATLTKLLRVALLAPLVLLLGWLLRQGEPGKTDYPWFLLGFALLFGCNSLGWVPPSLQTVLLAVSQGCLLLTMAALGMRTSLGSLVAQGWRPFILLVLLSVALLLAAMGALAAFSP